MSDKLFNDLPHVELRGFNVRPGVAFIRDENIWVATTKVTVDNDYEVVHVIARDGVKRGGDVENDCGYVHPQSFTFDFCEKVQVVGVVMNPNEPDDHDWGGPDNPESFIEREIVATKTLSGMPFDHAQELSIDFLAAAGLSPDSYDCAGDRIDDTVQSYLTATLLRMPLLGDLFELAVKATTKAEIEAVSKEIGGDPWSPTLGKDLTHG